MHALSFETWTGATSTQGSVKLLPWKQSLDLLGQEVVTGIWAARLHLHCLEAQKRAWLLILHIPNLLSPPKCLQTTKAVFSAQHEGTRSVAQIFPAPGGFQATTVFW